VTEKADEYLGIWSQHSTAVLDMLRGLEASSLATVDFQYPRLPWYTNPDDFWDDDEV
jgi:hypothetical protein